MSAADDGANNLIWQFPFSFLPNVCTCVIRIIRVMAKAAFPRRISDDAGKPFRRHLLVVRVTLYLQLRASRGKLITLASFITYINTFHCLNGKLTSFY